MCFNSLPRCVQSYWPSEDDSSACSAALVCDTINTMVQTVFGLSGCQLPSGFVDSLTSECRRVVCGGDISSIASSISFDVCSAMQSVASMCSLSVGAVDWRTAASCREYIWLYIYRIFRIIIFNHNYLFEKHRLHGKCFSFLQLTRVCVRQTQCTLWAHLNVRRPVLTKGTL